MSEYTVDSRVRNETESLKNQYEIDVYCLNNGMNSVDESRNGIRLTRFGIHSSNKITRFITSYIAMLFYSLKQNITMVHAHDLNALPVAFLISKMKRVPLIYDSHELWSESTHGKYPQWVISFAKRIEIYCAHRAKHVITVSESIAEHLKKLFDNKNVSVIRNVPSYVHDGSFNLFREKFGIPSSTPIFLYQGLISEARGVKMILDALALLDKELHYSFVFLGNGPFKVNLKNLVSDYQLSERVLIEDAVSQDVLLKYTSSADIGVHAIDNSCLNHDYCLPNKIFEYVNAGIGVICPDLTELSKFINVEKVGTTYTCEDANALSLEIDKYIRNVDLITEAKNAAVQSRIHLNWQAEESILYGIYDRVSRNGI